MSETSVKPSVLRTIEYNENTQTLIGNRQRELVDVATGEVLQVDQITKMVYGTKKFWKIYLMDFLTILGIFDNRQVDVFIYIIENTDQSNNIFIGTYKKIAEDVGCSQTTIAKTMGKLQNHGFIKKVQNGVWMVNPDILVRGNDSKRQILLSYYQSPEPVNSITYARTKQEAIPTAAIPDTANQCAQCAETAELEDHNQ